MTESFNKIALATLEDPQITYHSILHHPQGDAQTERFNHTLLSMLGTLASEKMRQWSPHAGYLVSQNVMLQGTLPTT